MKTILTIFRATAAICVALASNTSFAVTVFDPSNFVQNTSTAIAAVKTEITAAAQYAQEIMQTYEMVRANTSLGGVTDLAGMQQEVQAFQELIAINTQLKGSMESSMSLMRNMQAGFGASNYSWETFLQQGMANDSGRADAYRGQFEQITRNLVETSARRKAILQKLDEAQGQTAATQAVGAQIDVLIGQQQQLINELAAAKQKDVQKIQEDRARADAYNAYNRRVQGELRQSSGRFITTYGQ